MANRAQLLSARRKSRQGVKIPKAKVLRLGKIFALVALVTVIIFLIPRLIPIRVVECETPEGECTQNLQQKISAVPTTNLASTKTGIVKVVQEQLAVKNYAIRFQLPATLAVYVVEREPIVAIAKEGATSDFALVDTEGVIVGIWQETNLPIMVVSRDSEYKAGQKLPEHLQYSVKVTSEAYKKFNSRLVILKSDVLEVELPSGIRVLFPLTGDLDILFGSLTLILSRVNSDTIKLLPSIIDLRYKNPVII